MIINNINNKIILILWQIKKIYDYNEKKLRLSCIENNEIKYYV